MNDQNDDFDVDPESNASVIAMLARRASAEVTKVVRPSYPDAAPFIVLRDGSGAERVEWLRGLADAPHRKCGTVKLHDVRSFIAYYAIHGNGSPVYATLQPARFVAVLNEHTAKGAGYRDHRADFVVKHSREWMVWGGHNGAGAKFNSNEAFALFLEENATDIVKPDPAVMLNIALNFRVKADVAFSVAQRLEDGNVEFGYSNLISAGAANPAGGTKLKIPEQFSIELPVWDGIESKKYRVDARFRYRLTEGKLSLWYELIRPHKIVEQAFKELWSDIEKATKAPILHGTAD